MLPVAALLIAGCGGGGSSEESSETTAATTATTTALSKEELIEQGDAICGEVNAAVGAIKPESAGSAARVADLYSGMVKSLKNLGTPEETEGDYGEYVNWMNNLDTAENEVKLAAERGDTAALEAAEENAATALTSFQLSASEYGFKDCSEGPTAPAAGTSSGSGSSEASEVEAGGAEAEAAEPEAVEPEVEEEPASEAAPETGGAEGGGGGSGAPEGGGGSTGGSSGGIGPG